VRHLWIWATAAGQLTAALYTLRKGFLMFEKGKQIFAAMVLAVMAVEADADGDGTKGEAKKAAAIAKFQQALKGLLPEWLVPVAANCADFLVETAVGWAKRQGFFAQLSAELSSSPAKQ
jgi:tellurite resistance protein